MGMKPVLNEPHGKIMNAGTDAQKVSSDSEITNAGTKKSGGDFSPQSQIEGATTPPPKKG